MLVSSFDSQDLNFLTAVLERVCSDKKAVDESGRQAIAARIMHLAQTGERDFEALRKYATDSNPRNQRKLPGWTKFVDRPMRVWRKIGGIEMLYAPTVAAVGVLALMSIGSPVLAETMMFKADLKGTNEVPPTDSAGQGNAMVTLDIEGKTVSWKVIYKGLTGDATAAHFHGPADSGANAGPAVDISGKIEEGAASVTDQQIADIQSIKWYLNIHTAKYPDGEIRGQLEPAK